MSLRPLFSLPGAAPLLVKNALPTVLEVWAAFQSNVAVSPEASSTTINRISNAATFLRCPGLLGMAALAGGVVSGVGIGEVVGIGVFIGGAAGDGNMVATNAGFTTNVLMVVSSDSTICSGSSARVCSLVVVMETGCSASPGSATLRASARATVSALALGKR